MDSGTMDTLRNSLCHLCDVCDGIYMWCEHVGVPHRMIPFEEARAVAAKHLLRMRFGDGSPRYVTSIEKIHREAYEVFGASEDVA